MFHSCFSKLHGPEQDDSSFLRLRVDLFVSSLVLPVVVYVCVYWYLFLAFLGGGLVADSLVFVCLFGFVFYHDLCVQPACFPVNSLLPVVTSGFQ